MHTHHVVYKSKGGSDIAEDLATVCTDCHTKPGQGSCHPLGCAEQSAKWNTLCVNDKKRFKTYLISTLC